MPGASKLNSFLKQLPGFNKVIQNITFLSASQGNCTASCILSKDDVNFQGGMHGGYSATLIDVVSSLGLLTYDSWNKASVSVNLDLIYVKGAKEGDSLLIVSNMIKAGRQIAFLNCEIRNTEDNSVPVKATHTKYISNSVVKFVNIL